MITAQRSGQLPPARKSSIQYGSSVWTQMDTLPLILQEELTMSYYMLVGCDIHENSALIKWSFDKGEPHTRSFRTTDGSYNRLIRFIQEEAEKEEVEETLFAYEASVMGFGLYDDLTAEDITCYVLAPTKMARSPKQRRQKCDEKDAEDILERLRGHVLAGNELPSIWIPDKKTRHDRAIVRRRLQLSKVRTRVKCQIRMILKKSRIKRPDGVGKGWTKAYYQWLRSIADVEEDHLPCGEAIALDSYLRELQWVEQEIQRQDHNIEELSQQKRYALPCQELCKLKGVALLTAMTFLTEMGDMSRFSNRRQIGAYLGLVSSQSDSGKTERKGHITKQGPARVRGALSQASWTRTGVDDAYRRIAARNPGHKKIALVAVMRRLAVRMWHIAEEAQKRGECFADQETPAGVT